MPYPTDRTTFKLWVKQQADENALGDGPFAGDDKLEAIIDNVIAEFSEICPLWLVGTITISGRYAILPDDWVDGPEWNTNLLYALQRGINPESVDLSQAGYDAPMVRGDGAIRFGGSCIGGNGYGYGTGGESIQDPIVPPIPHQSMPESSSAIIDGVQKTVFILPARTLGDGASFEVRYCALHKIQDANEETETPAMMTIKKIDLSNNFDRIFARVVKGRIFAAINANEVAGEDKFDVTRLKNLSDDDALIKKYSR